VRQCQVARTGAVASLLYALLLLSAGHACAAEGPQKFDIAPQSLAGALTEYAQQSQQEILFAPDLLVRKTSVGLQGTMRPPAALKILLDGSGLSYTSTPNGAILIGRANGTAGAGPISEAGGPAAVSEVIVSARRGARQAQLIARITGFIDEVSLFAADDPALGPAQWHEPVCPQVSGLPKERGESILSRISQVALAANVPLGGEHCRPNLYIYVTVRPQEILQDFQKRDFVSTFGADAPPTAVDNFIETPRAVRVWYNPFGPYLQPKALLPGGGCLPPENMIPVRVECNREPSRLVSNARWEFSRILVIADQTRLKGVTLEQFADYVAMVGLARLNPNAHLGDAPTILRLFNGSPQGAPAGMSDWDQAFLRSLYGTEPRSTLQRSQMARSMVRQIAP
jgi:hypothetical protein